MVSSSPTVCRPRRSSSAVSGSATIAPASRRPSTIAAAWVCRACGRREPASSQMSTTAARLPRVSRSPGRSWRAPRGPTPRRARDSRAHSPMSLIADEEVTVRARRDRIWSVFASADLLASVLPGCERLEATGDGSFSGVLATKLQFLTLRADVTATIVDAEPPDRLRLELVGRPRGLAGGFRAAIPITLEDSGTDTRVHYQLDLTTSGRLA